MIGWAAFKLLFGGFLKSAGSFIAKNWRWLLPLLAVIALWWYIDHLQSQRDTAIRALNSYVETVSNAAREREIENRQKARTSAILQAEIKAGHETRIDNIRRESDAKLQNAHLAAAGTIDLWRERVRLEVARNAAAVSQFPGTAEQPAQSGGNGDPAAARRAYDTLEAACKVTTADYNALHESWDAACTIYGCQ